MSTPVHQEPIPFKRNEDGLVEGVQYKRAANGRIDWKAMINPAHIVFNRKLDAELLEKFGAAADMLNYSEIIKTKTVEEKYILVLLQGFIELADLRGYESCDSKVAHAEIQRGVVSTCHISWIPNLEELGGKISSGVADATDANTSGFGYLAAMSDNRAFVRAVRRGLGISIMAFDEISSKDNLAPESGAPASGNISPLSPQGTLKMAAESCGFTFVQIKAGASSKYRAKIQGNPEEWVGFESVPPQDCMTLVGIVKEAKATTDKAAAEKAAKK